MEDDPRCRSNCRKLASVYLESIDEMQKMDPVQNAPQLANDRQQRAGCGRYYTCCCRRYTVLAVVF